MLDRYTKKAQQALSLAEDIAEELGHSYIGTEHILVGLLEEGTGVAARLLEAYGVREDKVLDLIRRLIAPSNPVSLREPHHYSPSAAAVLENSYVEARRFKSQLIGTEHILIAMLKKVDCSATRLLTTNAFLPVFHLHLIHLQSPGVHRHFYCHPCLRLPL